MKSFNEYKNGIDTVTDAMKTELFDFINNIDFKSFDSVQQSLAAHKNYERFELVFEPVIEGLFSFDSQNIMLKYNHDDKTVKIMDLDDSNNYIEVIATVGLLQYISTSSCSLDMTKKPIIKSNVLDLDIEKYFFLSSKNLSNVLVYNSTIAVDNLINCNVFFILDDKDIIIEGKIEFDEHLNINIQKMDIYNVGKKELDLISKYTTKELNVTAIKYIFENITPFEIGDSLSSYVEDYGFEYFDSDEFNMMLELKIAF